MTKFAENLSGIAVIINGWFSIFFIDFIQQMNTFSGFQSSQSENISLSW
jgi:hypothetical protein